MECKTKIQGQRTSMNTNIKGDVNAISQFIFHTYIEEKDMINIKNELIQIK